MVTAIPEVAVTLAFGFVHGFGFADTLRELGLHGRLLIVPTFGFNVRLELAQLLAAALIVPSLWVLARSRTMRIVIAGTSGTVAACWAIQRAFDAPNPTSWLADAVLATPERLAAILAVVALASAAWHRSTYPADMRAPVRARTRA